MSGLKFAIFKMNQLLLHKHTQIARTHTVLLSLLVGGKRPPVKIDWVRHGYGKSSTHYINEQTITDVSDIRLLFCAVEIQYNFSIFDWNA